MTHTFVFKPEAVFIKYSEIINNYSVIKRTASGEPAGFKRLYVPQKSESPSLADLSHELPAGKNQLKFLISQQRVLKGLFRYVIFSSLEGYI